MSGHYDGTYLTKLEYVRGGGDILRIKVDIVRQETKISENFAKSA